MYKEMNEKMKYNSNHDKSRVSVFSQHLHPSDK